MLPPRAGHLSESLPLWRVNLDNLTMPIVCTNVDSQDKSIDGQAVPHLPPQYKLAVIVIITDTISTISNSDDTTTFADPIKTIQYWADYVYAHEHVERVTATTYNITRFEKKAYLFQNYTIWQGRIDANLVKGLFALCASTFSLMSTPS
ncbi:hypothetical protein MVEN_00252300 [Mycena venus]|uniref:Uncharacterized protein n=1 Tax=Mycena venus TaxID=2733690 RepID=A0A8H6Z3M0_9AGAR|nr:hypothetical protein MVEN_00252300 [Mycena venus]